MGVWARLAWGPGVLATGAFWVLAASASSPSHSSALSLGLGDISIHLGRGRKRWKRITRLTTSTSISRKILMGMDSGITSTTLMMTMTVFPTSRMMMMTGMG